MKKGGHSICFDISLRFVFNGRWRLQLINAAINYTSVKAYPYLIILKGSMESAAKKKISIF
jgi:hypothetical protein